MWIFRNLWDQSLFKSYSRIGVVSGVLFTYIGKLNQAAGTAWCWLSGSWVFRPAEETGGAPADGGDAQPGDAQEEGDADQVGMMGFSFW